MLVGDHLDACAGLQDRRRVARLHRAAFEHLAESVDPLALDAIGEHGEPRWVNPTVTVAWRRPSVYNRHLRSWCSRQQDASLWARTKNGGNNAYQSSSARFAGACRWTAGRHPGLRGLRG